MFTAALVRVAKRKGQVSTSRKVGTTRYVHIKKRFSATEGHSPSHRQRDVFRKPGEHILRDCIPTPSTAVTFTGTHEDHTMAPSGQSRGSWGQ